MRIRRGWLFIGCALMLPYMGTQIYQKYRPSVDWQQSTGGFVVHMKENGVDRMIEEEDYIAGAMAAILAPEAHIETYKTMAVVLRTYITYMVHSGTLVESQMLGMAWLSPKQRRIKGMDEEKIQEALKETKGVKIYYENAVILPLYYEASNGTTRSFFDVWGSEIPYLINVESAWDKSAPDYLEKQFLSKEKVIRLLDADQSSIGSWNESLIQIVEKDDSGYIQQIQIGGTTYTGEELRCRLGLNSACFEYKIKAGGIEFVCYGKGHGVGLSIYGANAMAKEGKTWKEILLWYFSGASV